MTVTAYTLAVVLNLFCVFLGYRFLFQPPPPPPATASPPGRTATPAPTSP